MALLTNPLYGDEATGPLAFTLAFRRSSPYPTVARLPSRRCRPSFAQASQRSAWAAAVSAWHSLDAAAQAEFAANHPPGFTGFNFFLSQHFDALAAWFFFAVPGEDSYFDSNSAFQISDADFDLLFPDDLDFLPVVVDGRHSVAALLLNSVFSILTDHENLLLSSSL